MCGGGGVEHPSTMGEELTSHIIHPCAATALAVHDNSPANDLVVRREKDAEISCYQPPGDCMA